MIQNTRCAKRLRFLEFTETLFFKAEIQQDKRTEVFSWQGFKEVLDDTILRNSSFDSKTEIVRSRIFQINRLRF